jgi:hypothetical protein
MLKRGFICEKEVLFLASKAKIHANAFYYFVYMCTDMNLRITIKIAIKFRVVLYSTRLSQMGSAHSFHTKPTSIS